MYNIRRQNEELVYSLFHLDQSVLVFANIVDMKNETYCMGNCWSSKQLCSGFYPDSSTDPWHCKTNGYHYKNFSVSMMVCNLRQKATEIKILKNACQKL